MGGHEMKTAVVLLSGGVDSTALAYRLLHEGFTVRALGVDYGQRHILELTFAKAIARQAEIPFLAVSLAGGLGRVLKEANSSQVGRLQEVPTGHYADEVMKATIVPNRNMFLIALAGMYAEAIGAQVVGYAAHAGDHAIYPDCRPEFVEAAAHTLSVATDGRVQLYAPFNNVTKTDIVREGATIGVPFHMTYSCYRGHRGHNIHRHCGVCGTCTERREAFRDANVPDPTTYETE